MKLIFSFLVLCFFQQACLAQGEANNWYFGVRAGLTFRSGAPQPVFDSQMFAAEGCATISDRAGNLLFYSDGYFIWNRNHERMKDNGILSIIGDNGDGTQTGVIVPWPGRDSLYFVFSIGQLGGNLYYSVVNMNRNGGLGEVVVKKVLLQKEVCEKLTAVRHCNKRDYWIVTRKFNSDEYGSFLLTDTGISNVPVLSATGNVVANTNGMEFTKTMGYLKSSPDGRLLAAAHYVSDYVELTDFNTTTGRVSNPRKLSVRPEGVKNPILDGAYGIEFSRTSRVLYVSSYYEGPHNDTTALYQFDVSKRDEASIQASRVFLYGADWSHNMLGALQAAPDGKIYVAKYSFHISVINRPEILGKGCQFVPDAINIDDGSRKFHCDFGLPNFVQSYFNDPVIVTGNCEFRNISFSVQNLAGSQTVLWDFGDPLSGASNTSTSFSPTHIFSKEGAYQIKAILNDGTGCGLDTITRMVHAGKFSVSLGRDTTICQGDTLWLRVKVPNGNATWSDGSNETFLSVTKSGKYWVRVKLGDCTASDTVSIAVRPLPTFTLGRDTTICSSENLLLTATTNAAAPTFLWNDGTTTPGRIVRAKGIYWLNITDQLGCQYRDSIFIDHKSLPQFSLGTDTALCQTDLQLNASVAGASMYQWSTGSSTPSITATQSGIYWADVTKDNCTYRDSIDVTFKPYPKVNLGGDTTLCEGGTLLLDAQHSGSGFLWQDHSQEQTFVVTKAGTYTVTVTKNNCRSEDAIRISYERKPVFRLGDDFSICARETVTLQPLLQTAGTGDYLWQDGANDRTYGVSRPGTYHLTISNDCGSASDTIVVVKGTCKLFVPTAFTPNGDGLNDVFKVSGGNPLLKFKMEVYNRWGEKVFESNDIKKGWDGSFRQKKKAGVYGWIIRYDTAEAKGQLLKGTISLLY